MSVFEALRRRSIRDPHGVAIIDVGGDPLFVASASLVDAVSRRAKQLAAEVNPHGVVGQCPRNEIDIVTDCLALESLGVPSIQIASAEDPAPGFVTHVIGATGDVRQLPDRAPTWPLPASSSPDGLIRLANTSGTTGQPRTIAFSRAMVEARLKEYQDVFGDLLARSGNILSYMGLASPLGYFMLGLAMTLGKAFVINPSRGFQRERPDSRIDCQFVLTSPASCAELWAARKIGLHPVFDFAHVILAGAPSTSALREQVKDVLGAEAYCLYGSAEAGPIAFANASGLDLDNGEVGRLREGCQPLPQLEGNRRDATRFQAPCVAPYLDAAILTTGKVSPLDVWQSSDVCRVGADGGLVCEGRFGFVLNIGGDKFNIEDVERRILALGNLKSVCVLPVLDALGVQRIALFICPDKSFMRAEFEERFRKSLSSLLFPIRFFEIDEMPMAPSGKIRRDKLRKLAGL